MTNERQSKMITSIVERRRQVAALDLRHIDQVDIGRQLGVDQSTVSRDIAALRSEWRADAATDVQERIGRELAELDQMERDSTLEFSKTKDSRWMTVRLAIKSARRDLLGLDAPKRTEISGRGGGPIDVTLQAAVVDLRTVILLALEPYPEARQVVADALAGR